MCLLIIGSLAIIKSLSLNIHSDTYESGFKFLSYDIIIALPQTSV